MSEETAMTPEQKIEALRELFDNIDGNIEELKQGAWWDGFYWTRQKVRDIIDPPKPKWLEMVDALPRYVTGTHLGAVLYHLSHVANPDHYDVAEELANIVVVCEAQVGDGWRADPDDIRGYSSENIDVLFIVEALTNFYQPAEWKIAGNRAAAWLRATLDGDA